MLSNSYVFSNAASRQGGGIYNSANMKVSRSLVYSNVAEAGGGIYQRADYRQRDTDRILDEVKAQALPGGDTKERTRVWNERFYWLAGLALLLLLPLFRRTLPGYQVRGT